MIELGIVLPVCDALPVAGGVRRVTAAPNWYAHGALCDFSATQSNEEAKPFRTAFCL